ncbi:MAG: hypothetical protein WBP81_11250 [Solirubrobacteraceae bacterium]
MDEARRVAPTAPQGQKRILAIDHRLVYRLRHGRWRGATWLEEDAARFWLLAAAQRAAGSRQDAYEVFVALHEAGQLLPTDDDQLRDVFERDARVLAAARAEAASALEAAAAARESDVMIRFGEFVGCCCRRAATRFGSRLPHGPAEGAFVAEGLRELLFAIVFDARIAREACSQPPRISGAGRRNRPRVAIRAAALLPPERDRRTCCWRRARQRPPEHAGVLLIDRATCGGLDRRRERACPACPCRRANERPARPGGGEVPRAATGRSPW